MKWQSNFMKEPLEQLEKIIQDYDAFSLSAERLKWLDIKEQHENWFRSYPLGILLDVFEFPQDYNILHHITDVYTRTVLSNMAYYEEWEGNFWDTTSWEERRNCLTKGEKLYKNYATFRELRLIERDWPYLVKEITYFANENKIPPRDQKKYLDQFENAKVIELGGAYIGDADYWAIKRNSLMIVSCGCWD